MLKHRFASIQIKEVDAEKNIAEKKSTTSYQKGQEKNLFITYS